jgi:hydroxyacylglutathione hydrolase
MKAYHLTGSRPYYTNCYILTDNKGNGVMIDASADVEKIKKILENDRSVLKAIFLTHGHDDHRETLEEILEEFNCPVYLGKEDAKFFNLENTISFEDRASFDIGEMNFFVFATPGHTPGGFCIVCNDMMFSGDTLFAGTVGRTDLDGGDYTLLTESIKKILTLVKTNVKVFPGHNHFSTLDIEKKTNPYLINALKEMEDKG